ncbi:MAG: carboxylesterase family protein [Rhodococcus sp. (in: high G+C Gram-positive bacteria)]|nr:carboxylesterase family protein [Rhodococcus sp. (in: high G+C Gram-positive bacteria)]
MTARATLSAIRVETTDGQLEGFAHQGTQHFLGVPYAQKPIGTLRFRPPQPVTRRNETLTVTASRTASLQPGSFRARTLQGLPGPTSEDALWLNVWRPDTPASDLPVLVWIHGGAFTNGSAALPSIDGAALARTAGIVVVTINYRLGALGFASHPELTGEEAANLGLLDQIAAMRWIHREIESFGGDPGRTTLAGESAGAISAALIAQTESARGLFSQLILHSGVAQTRPHTDIVRATEALAGEIGVGPSELRTVPGDILIAATSRIRPLHFWPSAVGEREAQDDASLPSVPTLISTAADEGTFFMLESERVPTHTRASAIDFLHAVTGSSEAERMYDAASLDSPDSDTPSFIAARSITQALFDGPADSWALRAQTCGSEVFRARQRVPTTVWGGWLGATHTLEIPLLFGTYCHPQLAQLYPAPNTEGRARRLQNSWIHFIETGRPGGEWMPWSSDGRHVHIFG